MSVRELLPLSVDGSGGYVSPGGFFLTSADGIEIVATCWDGAIAAEIVRACNSHEALVEALRGLTDSVQRMVHRLDAEPGNQIAVSLWMTKIDAAHAALALAESK